MVVSHDSVAPFVNDEIAVLINAFDFKFSVAVEDSISPYVADPNIWRCHSFGVGGRAG